MNVLDRHRYEMLERVRDFGAAHPDLFPPTTLAAKMFATIDAAVGEMSQDAASQVSGHGSAREGSMSKAVARVRLHESLDAINRTAHALALDDDAALDGKFRLPRSGSDQSLLSAARAFLQDAKPLCDGFVAHCMPPTFLEELATQIDDFEQANRAHVTGNDAHIAARAGFEVAMQTGLVAVQRLDRPILTVWFSARHVEQGPRSRQHLPAPMPGAALTTEGGDADRSPEKP